MANIGVPKRLNEEPNEFLLIFWASRNKEQKQEAFTVAVIIQFILS